MIESAEEFIRLRTSEVADEYRRTAHEPAPDAVWQELVAQHPDMRFWVAQNKTVPAAILELLHTDPAAEVRSMVARKRKLSASLQQALASDADPSVRHTLACNAKADLVVLQQLAADSVSFVREAAQQRLHSHGRHT